MTLLALSCVFLLGICAQASANHRQWHSNQTLGTEEMIWDFPGDKCPEAVRQSPDMNPRAYRAFGQRWIILPWQTNYRLEVDQDLKVLPDGVDCNPIMTSTNDPRPEAYNDSEWISAAYVHSGGEFVYALIHNEYRPWEHPGACPRGGWRPDCWMASVTSAFSDDIGASFHNPNLVPPTHLVATRASKYIPGTGILSMHETSNIIQHKQWDPNSSGPSPDNAYYAFATRIGEGQCLLRAESIGPADPVWQAWDGFGFGMNFVNPYVTTPTSECTPVDADIGAIVDSVVWSDYYKKYMVIGDLNANTDPKDGLDADGKLIRTPGIYFSLSSDLVNWSERQLIKPRAACGPEGAPRTAPSLGQSLLDPDSEGDNYETIDRNAYLYWICNKDPGRDVERVPVEFNPVVTASIAISPLTENGSVSLGETVTLTADASSNPAQSIPSGNYRWDLDGDEAFDDATGITVSHAFNKLGRNIVRLEVTDSGGNVHETWAGARVEAQINMQKSSSPVPAGYVKDIGEPYADGPGQRGYGWVREDSLSSTHEPLDLTLNTIDRAGEPWATGNPLLDTFIFMQAPNPCGCAPTKVNGALEIATTDFGKGDKDGLYRVEVSVGDAKQQDITPTSYPWTISSHRINVEGQTAVVFTNPSAGERFKTGTAILTTEVTDGRLTIDALGGSNTKLNYVTVSYNNSLPKAEFHPLPNPAFRNEPLTFNASNSYTQAVNDIQAVTEPEDAKGAFAATDAGGEIVKYEWDFTNDGSIDATTTKQGDTPAKHYVTHSYPVAGTKTARLRVTDDDGATDEVTHQIKVAQGVTFAPESVAEPANYLEDIGQEYPSNPDQDGGAFEVENQPLSHFAQALTAGPRCRTPLPAPETFNPAQLRCYGWVREDSVQAAAHDTKTHVPLDLTANTVDRAGSPTATGNPLLDTFIYMQAPVACSCATKVNGAWEIPVKPGRYEVTVSVGDANEEAPLSSHNIRVEDVTVVTFTNPSASDRFRTGTITVDVADGRLTMDAIGGTNTKPNYIDIKRRGDLP